MDEQTVREKLRAFIVTELIRDDGYALSDDEGIISGGLMDSFSLAELGVYVEEEFDVYIPPEVKPGTYGVRVQLWRGDTPVGDPVPLGTITVGPPEGG